MPTDKEAEIQHLKTHLAISPKTANLLHAAGYATPQSLATATPNEVGARFAALPGMDAKAAKWYVGAGRRMVMLGTIDDPDKAASVAKEYQNWSNIQLKRLGIWEDGFNDLTGLEIRQKMDSIGVTS